MKLSSVQLGVVERGTCRARARAEARNMICSMRLKYSDTFVGAFGCRPEEYCT